MSSPKVLTFELLPAHLNVPKHKVRLPAPSILAVFDPANGVNGCDIKLIDGSYITVTAGANEVVAQLEDALKP